MFMDRRPSSRREHFGPVASRSRSVYLLDRGYVDFARLYVLAQACAFFVTRAKKNMQFYRRSSRPVKRSAGLRSDQTILLTGVRTLPSANPRSLAAHPLFRCRERFPTDLPDQQFLSFPALTITQLYRWHVGKWNCFFRWIKQHLRIKAFYGTSENAV